MWKQVRTKFQVIACFIAFRYKDREVPVRRESILEPIDAPDGPPVPRSSGADVSDVDRRRVIVIIHSDDDSEEDAERWAWETSGWSYFTKSGSRGSVESIDG